MAIRRARRPQAALDMTPMIDCVFQLLIFFMLSSSMVTPQIRLDLPRAQARDPANGPEIVLSATADGKLFLNHEPVEPGELSERLRPLLERSRTKVVTFRGDRKLDYERFMAALDAARAAGARNLDVSHR